MTRKATQRHTLQWRYFFTKQQKMAVKSLNRDSRRWGWILLGCIFVSISALLLSGTLGFNESSKSIETACGGPDLIQCPESQCCSMSGTCGTSVEYCGLGCQNNFGQCSSIKSSQNLEASQVGRYFAQKSLFEYYILLLSFLGLGEWLIFTVLNLMTFRNVYLNPDSTTSPRAVVITSISYVTLRLLFLPFYLAGTYLSIPGYEDYQLVIFKTGTIALAVWWNFIMIMPCITIWLLLINLGMRENLMESETNYWGPQSIRIVL